jgi:tubulin monoglycylase TTLL3/8
MRLVRGQDEAVEDDYPLQDAADQEDSHAQKIPQKSDQQTSSSTGLQPPPMRSKLHRGLNQTTISSSSSNLLQKEGNDIDIGPRQSYSQPAETSESNRMSMAGNSSSTIIDRQDLVESAPAKPKADAKDMGWLETNPDASCNQGMISPRNAAGSALAAIRSHRSPTAAKLITAAADDERFTIITSQEADEEDEGKLYQQRVIKAKALHQKEKMQSYLASIAEQRKRLEQEKKLKDERVRRRAYLLRVRLMTEAAERKAMAVEDDQTRSARSHSSAAEDQELVEDPAIPTNRRNNNASTDALVERLTKTTSNKQISTIITPSGKELPVSSAHYRDYRDWKHKNRIPMETQVFSMTGWYPCVRQALLDRGWMQNSDPNSPFCDLKWTLKSIDIAADQLQPWQLTNHFFKNMAITTKAGLLKSLQPLTWFADISAGDIFPRGYDLSIPEEMQSFIDDFRIQNAASILKRIYFDLTGDPHINATSTTTAMTMLDNDQKGYQVNKAVVYACCDILERMLHPLDEDYLDVESGAMATEEYYAMTALEWEIIASHPVNAASKLAESSTEGIDSFLHAKTRQHPAYTGSSKDRSLVAAMIKEAVPMTSTLLQRIVKILTSLAEAEGGQFAINGDAASSRNLWIVKPAAKSRGRGIMTFRDLPKLLKYVEAGDGSSSANQWIVQKYIENPLLIANRKFDLRQWVLVTDWNPLTIYFYDEFYARFSVEEYDASDDGLENCYIHLVNNSIGKNSDNFTKAAQTETGIDLDGYMLAHADFSKHIEQKTGDASIAGNIQQKLKVSMLLVVC